MSVCGESASEVGASDILSVLVTYCNLKRDISVVSASFHHASVLRDDTSEQRRHAVKPQIHGTVC